MASVAAPAPAPSPVATEDFVTSAVTDATTAGPFIDTNTQYLLSSAYLVFFMHCGFAMVRSPASSCFLTPVVKISLSLHRMQPFEQDHPAPVVLFIVFRESPDCAMKPTLIALLYALRDCRVQIKTGLPCCAAEAYAECKSDNKSAFD